MLRCADTEQPMAAAILLIAPRRIGQPQLHRLRHILTAITVVQLLGRYIWLCQIRNDRPETPNHALQRTATRLSRHAASGHRLSPTTQRVAPAAPRR